MAGQSERKPGEIIVNTITGIVDWPIEVKRQFPKFCLQFLQPWGQLKTTKQKLLNSI